MSPPFRRVLVANRGEIAVRVLRACQELGIHAIAVYSEADRGALHTRLADEAHPIGPPPARESYLNETRILEVARLTGAEAIHPGYGFLSENADFAAACAAAKVTFVGPPPAAMRLMGDKAAARRLVARHDVPVVPGYDGADQSDAALATAAGEIGYPLLVKPAAGGGGKGMRTVRDPAALPAAIASARREAQAAFGDERLILERLVEGPRHVEVQVLFDAHGNGIHLGERDCSIQRRHQKILEESPSPAVDERLRERLGEAALELAGAVGYVSTGTCEFLVDDRGRFLFLEMNTRLQVEHPVTEMVTGRDLVADQLRIAAGEALGVAQVEIEPSGHAVEVRLYAEDAEDGFLPATGRIEALRWPSGEGIRVDAGIEVGMDVGGRFDPMLAKVVAHGRDRAQAFDRLVAALDETLVLGLVTNLRFLRWLVRQPVVRDGEARIDTLDRIWPPDGWADRARPPEEAWGTAAAALTTPVAGTAGTDPWAGAWRLNARPIVRLTAENDQRAVPLDRPIEQPPHIRTGDTVHVDVAGRSVPFRLAPPPDVDRAARAAARVQGGGPAELTAPMPGSVLAVHVTVDAPVEAGDPIVTLEAMKMEHVVGAPVTGRVTELLVAPGDQVTRGQPLATVGR